MQTHPPLSVYCFQASGHPQQLCRSRSLVVTVIAEVGVFCPRGWSTRRYHSHYHLPTQLRLRPCYQSHLSSDEGHVVGLLQRMMRCQNGEMRKISCFGIQKELTRNCYSDAESSTSRSEVACLTPLLRHVQTHEQTDNVHHYIHYHSHLVFCQ